jgi:hypothetical protein
LDSEEHDGLRWKEHFEYFTQRFAGHFLHSGMDTPARRSRSPAALKPFS